ncbi:MAG: thiamine-phosphate kinase [Planctomycetota bacterium]
MVAERAFTRGLARFFQPPPGRGALGIGDDAAVVSNRGARTVVACDPVVEGVHFAPDAPLRLVGRKAVFRNLADLAAMGAVFDYAVVSVLWPSRRPARQLRALMCAVRDAVEGHGGYVVGGDTGSTPGPLTVTVTALGHLRGRPLCRSGARAGDVLFVSAPLGGAILGHHLRFEPPLALGQRLARRRDVTAAIDVSDGLSLDLHTLLCASSSAAGRALCADLMAARIPVSAAARRLARTSGQSALQHALGDGEDHALLYAVRPGRRSASLPRHAIGVVRACARGEAAGTVFLCAPGGAREAVAAGYEHVLGGDSG